MGLLNSVLGALHRAPVGGDALQAAVAMLAQGDGAPGSAGLHALVRRFEQGGLGEVVASWISAGANLPVSPVELERVLGGGMLARFAAQFGVPRADAAQELAEVLPRVVDQLTPQGRLPCAGHGLGDIDSLLGPRAAH